MNACNKKILIVVSEFPPGPGGIGMHAFSMAKAFDKKGFEVNVIASGDYVSAEDIAAFDAQQCFKIIRFRRNIHFSHIQRFRLVGNFVRTHHIKTVFVSNRFSLWIGLWLKITNPSIRLIGILHGSEVNPSSFIWRKITHLAMIACNQLVAVSKFTQFLVPDWIRQRKKITVIPNGIDEHLLLECADAPVVALEGFPKLLTVGNVTPRKGQQRIIKALPELIKQYPDIHYHIVGLPTFQAQFLQLALNLGVERHITFHGRAQSFKALASFYRSADIFLILSENQKNGDVEGFGIVVLEAGYYGLPTIGAENCGIEDAIQENYNGFLVDGDNPSQIIVAMEKCLNTKKILSVQSNQWAKDHSWNNIIDQYIDLIP